MAFSIKIDGRDLKRLENALEEKGKSMIGELDVIVEASAFAGLEAMKRATPVDMGTLRNANSKGRIGPAHWSLFNNEPYAPFVEFGTGKKVDIPPELQAVASQFKGGKGIVTTGTLLDAIREWAGRKGIPDEAVYPIYLSILRNGINAHPFLQPAFRIAKKFLVQDIKDYIRNFEL